MQIAVARGFQGARAQTFIDFLDQVMSELSVLCSNDLKRQMQVLVHSRLDGEHRQLCLRLLSKICKAQRIMPASYNLCSELIRVGNIQDRGGYSEVSDGIYLGFAVAIKDLKTKKDDFDKMFKVGSINLAPSRCSALNFHPAFLSRDCRLETLIPPKHIASGGGFCVNRPLSFSHPL